MKILRIAKTLIFTYVIISSSVVAAAEKHVIAGAGPSTKIATLFFELFQNDPKGKHYEFSVPQRSIKHAGGIAHSDRNVFGRTGRPLTAPEKAKNKEEIFLAGIPIVFVIGRGTNINSLTKQQLTDILVGKITNWSELGGPKEKIHLVGREKTEASLTMIRRHLPEIDNTNFDLMFSRDHHVTGFMQSQRSNYSLAFGVASNFPADVILDIKDLKMSQKVGLVFDVKNKTHPLVQQVQQFAESNVWKNVLKLNNWYAP